MPMRLYLCPECYKIVYESDRGNHPCGSNKNIGEVCEAPQPNASEETERTDQNPNRLPAGHLNENNGNTCPAAQEKDIEKSKEGTFKNNEQFSLLPPPGRKRKHNSLSTLDSFRGGKNNRLSDSEPSSSSHEERGGNEAAAKKSKKGSKMRRASAQVLPSGCPSNIEMSFDSSALGSGSVSVASEFPVAGPSGTQMQPHKTDKERPFVCDVCSKAFAKSGYLRVHYRTHSGGKPFVCDSCKKGFSQKGNLSRHLLTHTGERRFSCEVCGKGFTQKHSLQVHIRIHTGEKPYRCQWCGRQFSAPSSFRSHKKTCKAKNVVNSQL